MTIPIPHAAAAAWQALSAPASGAPGGRPLNPGLIFNRYGTFKRDWQDANKKETFQQVSELAGRTDLFLLRGWNARWAAAARAIGGEPFALKTDWRLITGLGQKGPLEAGFAFHRYGFPYLPASGVKGLARSAGLIAAAEALGDDGLEATGEAVQREWRGRGPAPEGLAALLHVLEQEKDEAVERIWQQAPAAGQPGARALNRDFRATFGTTGASGSAIFLDAIPSGSVRPKLDVEIMNPHVPDYYADPQHTSPSNWQNPKPVFFLTVAPGVEFRFAVGWRGEPTADTARLRAQAQAWLVLGLTELGAGAKTSAGYGFFLPSPASKPAEPTTATVASPAPPEPEAPLVWRTGTVREYQPERGVGRIVDDETGDVLRFTREAVTEKGWSPGRRARVRYATQGTAEVPTVVKIEKA